MSRFNKAFLFWFSLFLTWPAWSAVQLSATRIIYNAEDKGVSFQIENDGHSANLIQAWIDDGDATAVPSQVKVPFFILQPIFRLEAGQQKLLRIVFTGKPAMPAEESVYWLNVFSIPSASKAITHNQTQVAYRTRIKLFYRPAGLAGIKNDAGKKLKWALLKDRAGKEILRAKNASPFSVSIAQASFTYGGKNYALGLPDTVLPGHTTDFSLKEIAGSPKAPGVVAFQWINDSGFSVDETYRLSAGDIR